MSTNPSPLLYKGQRVLVHPIPANSMVLWKDCKEKILDTLEPNVFKARAEYTGFNLLDPEIYIEERWVVVRVEFVCPCKRSECLLIRYDLMATSMLQASLPNTWEELDRLGSFSREHLINDGFPTETVDRFMWRAEEFDRKNSLCLRVTYK